jgi:CRP-like cAMP-binding protein
MPDLWCLLLSAEDGRERVATTELSDTLAGFTIFSDLSGPELEAIAHTFEEQLFSEGQRVLRQGFTGAGFYVILEGEVAVRIDGEERARLSRGDFFGELSILLGEPPVADVVALGPLRCLVLPGPDLHDWLLSRPTVTFRMLQAELRRLRNMSAWRS